ncbi:hypothetical protein J6P68_03565 [bacterium]|nr:hypothetical protein [bacterium]
MHKYILFSSSYNSNISLYCSNYTLKSEQELMANKLSALISVLIIISSNLTTSEALS